MNNNNKFPNNNNKLPEGWGNLNNGNTKASPWENKSKTSAWENAPKTSAWDNTNNNSGNSNSKPKGANTENVNAAFNKFANMAKRAGEKAVRAASDAADYAKSDETAEKMNADKNKAKSLASSAGSKLSGIKNKVSDKISERKNKDDSSNENISAADEHDAVDNYDVSYDETIYQNNDDYAPDSIADDNVCEDTTDENELPLNEINNTVQYQKTANSVNVSTESEFFESNNTSEEISNQNDSINYIQNTEYEENINESNNYFERELSANNSVNHDISDKKTNKTIITTCCIISAAAVTATAVVCLLAVINQKNAEIDRYENVASNNEIIYDNNEEASEITTEKATEKSTEKESKSTTEVSGGEQSTPDIETPIISNKNVTICSPEEINNYHGYLDIAKSSNYSDSYFLCDINADGTPELFLTSNGSNEWIDQIYTIYDNNAVMLFDGTIYASNASRGLALSQNGIIIYTFLDGSSGMITSMSEYKGGEYIESIESIKHDLFNEKIYHTVGNKTAEITVEQVEKINEKYSHLFFNSSPIENLVQNNLNDAEMGKMYNLFCFELLCAQGNEGCIIDIDNDNIEELIYKSWFSTYVVLSYKNGEIQKETIYQGDDPFSYFSSLNMLSIGELYDICLEKAKNNGFTINNSFTRDSSTIGYVNTQGGTLNLRSEPLTNSQVITELPYGTFFNAYNVLDNSRELIDDKWIFISVNLSGTSYSGYVSLDYVSWVDTSI